MSAVLLLHIAAGAVALLTGFAALAATKGERLHRRAGVAFVAAMLVMGLSGAGVAAATGERVSVVGGLLAAYLTLSGFAVVRYLWRMCSALFIASGSFFLGQTDEIPAALRVWPVLIALAVLPLVVIPYFLWRVRGRRVARQLRPEVA